MCVDFVRTCLCAQKKVEEHNESCQTRLKKDEGKRHPFPAPVAYPSNSGTPRVKETTPSAETEAMFRMSPNTTVRFWGLASQRSGFVWLTFGMVEGERQKWANMQQGIGLITAKAHVTRGSILGFLGPSVLKTHGEVWVGKKSQRVRRAFLQRDGQKWSHMRNGARGHS